MRKKSSPFSKPRGRRRIPLVDLRQHAQRDRKSVTLISRLRTPLVGIALSSAAVLILLLICSGCGRGSDVVTGPASYSVSGTVSEGVEGDGMVASVSISNDAGVIATVTTDADGRFEFTGLAAGDMTIRATSAHHTPAQLGVRVPPSTNRALLRLMPSD